MESYRTDRIVLVVAAFACVSTQSCTNVLGIEDTSLQKAAKAKPSEDWSCVGQPRKAAAGGQIALKVTTIEFLAANQTQAVPDVEVRVCGRFDSLCDTGFTAAGPTSQTGELSSSIPIDPKKGFDNYLQFSKPGYKTLKWLFSQPRTSDKLVMTVAMVSDAGFAGLMESFQLTADPTKGHLTYSVVTCATDAQGGPVQAANAVVTVTPRDADAKGYYAGSEGGFIDDTTQTKTTTAGRGAVFNLSVAPVSINVVFGSESVSKEQGIPIQADVITTIDLLPEQVAAP